MTFYFNVEQKPWPEICADIMRFRKWVRRNSGYLYVDCRDSEKRDVESLLSHADLEDHFSFVGHPADQGTAEAVRQSEPWPLAH